MLLLWVVGGQGLLVFGLFFWGGVAGACLGLALLGPGPGLDWTWPCLGSWSGQVSVGAPCLRMLYLPPNACPANGIAPPHRWGGAEACGELQECGL